MTVGDLHIVRTDVLLWTLGGFAEPPKKAQGRTTIEPKLLDELRQVASRSKARHGELTNLARRFDRSNETLRVFVWKIRHGIEPRYWST